MIDGFTYLRRARAWSQLMRPRIAKCRVDGTLGHGAVRSRLDIEWILRAHYEDATLRSAMPGAIRPGRERSRENLVAGASKAPENQCKKVSLKSRTPLAPSRATVNDGMARTSGVAAAQSSPSSRPMPMRRVELPELPWVMGALAPVISSRTLQYHYSHHHATYVDAANELLPSRADAVGQTLLEVVRWAADQEPGSSLFQSTSQAWNHSFLWKSLAPERKRPSGPLREALEARFGDYTRFMQAFAEAGCRRFGSGWLWLTCDNAGRLDIQTTADADSPAARGERCLLTIDLWEHAYYLDHQDRRQDYLEAVIDRRLNWDFAADGFATVDTSFAADEAGSARCSD